MSRLNPNKNEPMAMNNLSDSPPYFSNTFLTTLASVREMPVAYDVPLKNKIKFKMSVKLLESIKKNCACLLSWPISMLDGDPRTKRSLSLNLNTPNEFQVS